MGYLCYAAASAECLFAKLGIPTYVFLPLLLTELLEIGTKTHDIGGRIPMDTIEPGLKAFLKVP